MWVRLSWKSSATEAQLIRVVRDDDCHNDNDDDADGNDNNNDDCIKRMMMTTTGEKKTTRTSTLWNDNNIVGPSLIHHKNKEDWEKMKERQ